MRRRLRDWADAFELWLDEHRSTRVARGAVVGFIAHDVLQYAGAMAYFAVLWRQLPPESVAAWLWPVAAIRLACLGWVALAVVRAPNGGEVAPQPEASAG